MTTVLHSRTTPSTTATDHTRDRALRPVDGPRFSPRPFTGDTKPDGASAPAAVTVTLTVALPPGTSDVDAAQLADALRGSADRLTSGRRARTRVELDAPLPFTRTRSSRGDLRALPPRRETPAASPLRPRPGAVVSPTSPARQDAEAARLRALRATAVSPQTPTGAQDSALVVDLYGRRVRIDGEDVDLTYKEFELLAHLARNPRRIIDRGELMGTVWADAGPETGERTVDVHVRRVRTKLGRYRRLISTIRGAGYRLDLGSDVAVLG